MNLTKLAEQVVWESVPDLVLQTFVEYQDDLLEKGAESPVLRELANIWQIRPGKMLGVIPNAPGPLSSMLVGGLAGAGIGHGAGWLAEKVLPEKWRRKNLRRTLAIAGGAMGALPGLGLAAINKTTGRPWNSSELLQAGYNPPIRPFSAQENAVLGRHPEGPQSTSAHTPFQSLLPKAAPEPLPKYDFTDPTGTGEVKISSDTRESFAKVALLTGTGIAGMPRIDVNEFNQVIWKDPRVARPLSPATRAAASGLLTSAAHLPGRRDTRFITPMDVGRITAGMGTGYASGALVGKALGVMLGMPQSTQERLKSTGMWAGIVSNIIPVAFGG